MKAVIIQLMLYDQVNDQGSTNAYSQPGHINQRKQSMFAKIAKGDCKIIFEHTTDFTLVVLVSFS
jgi:hypothetical protein